MKLDAQQIVFWEIFGYLVLPKLFTPAEAEAMTRDLDNQALEDSGEEEFKGERRQNVSIAEAPSFKDIADDERLAVPLEQLLGEGYVRTGLPGGGLYVGDTQWHPDHAVIREGDPVRLKAAFYLDPVRKDTGCLRVVPGSHANPLHDQLRPLRMGRLKKAIVDGSLLSNTAPPSEADEKELRDWEEETGIDLDDNNTIYGVDPMSVPSTPLESDPGDVVFFNQLLFHAAFGGRTGRRMVAMTLASASPA